MDREAEYLIVRNQVPRGQITTRIFILFIFLVIAYAAIWYFWPTSFLANLPYCMSEDLVLWNAPLSDQPPMLNGVYVSFRTGPRIDTFDLPWVHLLRFDFDGRVIYTFEIYQTRINWRNISRWFHFNSLDSRMLVGTYDIQGHNGIRITIRTFENNVEEWVGIIADSKLIFTRNDILIFNPFLENDTVVFEPYVVEQCPFGKK
jgi:hypothetical protein